MKVDFKVVTMTTYTLTMTEQERTKLISYLRVAGHWTVKHGDFYNGIDQMLRELGVLGLQ